MITVCQRYNTRFGRVKANLPIFIQAVKTIS